MKTSTATEGKPFDPTLLKYWLKETDKDRRKEPEGIDPDGFNKPEDREHFRKMIAPWDESELAERITLVKDAFETGDIHSICSALAGATGSYERYPVWMLDIIVENLDLLKSRDMLEPLLINVYTMTDVIWHKEWNALLSLADPFKLKAHSDDPGATFPLTVYRGLSHPNRKISTRRGCSWTDSYEKAKWFARRLMGGEPRVYKTRVLSADDYYFFTDERDEREFVLDPSSRNIYLYKRIPQHERV